MYYKRGVLILLSVIIYVSEIFFLIKGTFLLALVGFVLESAVLLMIAIESTGAEIHKQDSQDGEIILTLEQENKEARQRIEALEKELEENSKGSSNGEVVQESDFSQIKEHYESEIARLEEQLKLAVAGNGNEIETFLPPIEENEKDKEIIDIIKIAKETIDELSGFASDANIRIHISTTDESLLVSANNSRMRIMFRNIIDNSIKYMKKSGVLIVTISNIGEDIFIVLKDNGAGLSENETKHIFELNYQGSNRISGNGLGLTQAKAIVDYYGGTIYAKSNIGSGMGIYIQLPTT